MSRRSFGSDPKPRLRVPLLDLRAQYLPIRDDVERADCIAELYAGEPAD